MKTETKPTTCEMCGGCLGQMETYEQCWSAKQKRVQAVMGEVCKINAMVGMKEPYYYKNKVVATFGHDKSNPVCGVYKQKTRQIIPVDDCIINSQKASAIIGTIRDLLKSFKIKTYDPKTGHGLLRHVLVREAKNTGEVMVVLVLSSHIMPSKNNFVKALRTVHPEIVTIILNENYKISDQILGEKETTIYGKGFILDTIVGKNFRISSKSMYPVNPAQTEVLVQEIRALARLSKEDLLLDTYCGIGTLGILLSDDVRKVISVDSKPVMIRDAVSNAKRNQIKNIDFYTKEVGEFVSQVAASEKQKPNVVLVDPPKNGCQAEFVEALAQLNPGKVIYIGRNPEVLVKDIRQLARRGYHVDKAVGVDVQPWTTQTEVIVLLTK